jgi:N-acyl-D-aspartate/D-glutamate deacylase
VTADLLIGARISDGTGLPAFGATSRFDGRIQCVGRLSGTAARVIDADGSISRRLRRYTYYDAAHFELSASPSSWHGVTTVLTGNCGFTIAREPDDLDWLVLMLAKVEESAARARSGFRGGSIGDSSAAWTVASA